jgi:hypothetical protein
MATGRHEVVVKAQLGARISAVHHAMIDELCEAWGMNEGDLLQELIARAWREHRRACGLSESWDAALLARLAGVDSR